MSEQVMSEQYGSLTALGLTANEEVIYRGLLREPNLSLRAIAPRIGIDRDSAVAAITSLERQGLVTRSVDAVPHYLPTPPDVGVEVLILRRQAEMEQARLVGRALMDDFETGREARNPDLIEIVTGAEAVHQRFEQFQRGARINVQILDTPPCANPAGGGTLNQAEIDGLGRGVSYRVIYDKPAVESAPGVIDAITRYVDAGEQARFIQSVPLKLATIDGKYGFVPLYSGHTDMSRCIILRACSLLGVLLDVFDDLWARAIPLPVGPQTSSVHATAEKSPLSDEQQRLLSLLLAGLNDKAIAHHLGQSYRTARRRTASLLADLDAETHFQAGVQAVRRGWL